MGQSPTKFARTTGPELRLRALIGPALEEFVVAPGSQAAIGRSASCEVCLLNEAVSRRHATVTARGLVWLLTDEASRAGTFVNGMRLAPAVATPLGQGDLVGFGPWTFRVDVAGTLAGGGRPEPSSHGGTGLLHTLDDTGETQGRIERLPGRGTGLASQRFALLSECLEYLTAAADEVEMAEVVLDHTLRGTGYPRGAILTPGQGPGDVIVLASMGFEGAAETLTFSRSLLAEAANGASVVLGESASAQQPNFGASIAEMRVERAMCVPVKVGDMVCAFIYLDTRRGERTGSADSGPFCEAIARAYGLSLANHMRGLLERRQRELTGELESARSVQQSISPPSSGSVKHIHYAAHVEPGAFVAGDLFDVLDLPGGVALLLGDVSGHGAGPGMTMALTQAHLNAHLRAAGDLAAAVRSLNTYLAERSADGRFVSLFAALISPDGLMRFIDAGHGHWNIRRGGSALALPAEGRCLPLGIEIDAEFAPGCIQLAPGDLIVLYSDGVPEQRDITGEHFGLGRLDTALAATTHLGQTDVVRSAHDGVQAVFAALRAHAPGGRFDDDATLALLRFGNM